LQFWVSLVHSFVEWFPCCFLSIFCTSFSLINLHIQAKRLRFSGSFAPCTVRQ
jgi:hypothetical protein